MSNRGGVQWELGKMDRALFSRMFRTGVGLDKIDRALIRKSQKRVGINRNVAKSKALIHQYRPGRIQGADLR